LRFKKAPTRPVNIKQFENRKLRPCESISNPSKQYSQSTPTFCSLTIALLSYSAQQKKAIARARQGKIKERQELEKEEREKTARVSATV
jgi:cbb3-type cytochrome oxidase subunit 3